MGRLPLRLALPTPEELRTTAIHFLREGNEEEEARILSSCFLELGEVRLVDGGARQIDITLRCKRKELEALQPFESAKRHTSKLMDRIRRAVSVALPSGIEVGCMDARAAGPRTALPGNSGLLSEAFAEPPVARGPAEERKDNSGRKASAFQRCGDAWSVAFDGMPAFHLGNSLGASYLDHLLHHPGEPISAYDLETTIHPERLHVRPRDSIQPQQDAVAVKDYLRELERVRGQIEAARETGDRVEQTHLEADLASLEAQLEGRACAADAGERARNNVRKAVGVLKQRLMRGGKAERAFAEHIKVYISLGYKCIYNQPTGYGWA